MTPNPTPQSHPMTQRDELLLLADVLESRGHHNSLHDIGRAVSALRLAASRSSGAVREALELAYGLLWVVGCDRATLGGNALYLARKALLEQLDKAGQGRGITAARKVLNDEGAASGARYRVCCPADFYTLHRTDGGTSDASIGGGASGSLAALRDDGDSEGPTSADGLTAAIDALVPADGGGKPDVNAIAAFMYEAANPTMKWSYLWPSHNHLHARVRQQYIEAAARFQDSVAQRIEHSEPDEGRKDVGSIPIAVAALAQTEGGKSGYNANTVDEGSGHQRRAVTRADTTSVHGVKPESRKPAAGAVNFSPSEATPAPADEVRMNMTEDQIKRLVDRFLGWTLPENFNPDGGVSFKRLENRHHHPEAPPFYPMPTGTNLFDATQATGMVRHMLTDMPVALSTTPADATYKVGRWLSAALDDPAVCAEMKADINAWFAAGQPNAQPDPADDAAVAWQWRTRPEDNWTFSVSRLSLNDIGRTSSAFEERPLFTHPAKAVDVEAIGNKLRELTAWNGTLLYTEAAEWIAALLTTTGNASSETEGGR